jgi:hypothetical protein
MKEQALKAEKLLEMKRSAKEQIDEQMRMVK